MFCLTCFSFKLHSEKGAAVAEKEEEVYELSDETKALLDKRKVNKSGKGCFLCSLILKDVEKHGHLTGYPYDTVNAGQFPIPGKLEHIRLEKETPVEEKVVKPKKEKKSS